MRTLLTADRLLTPDGWLPSPVLLLEDGVLASIETASSSPLPQAAAHHSYPGGSLVPAYFDVHTHGCCGHDVMEATPGAFATIGSFLARHGVGAYLPTTITAPQDTLLRSLERLAKLLAADAPAQPGQARPLGIHLEGPFLSHAKRGAHPPADLLEPSIPFFDRMWQACQGRITVLTIAPELPGAPELIEHAIHLGVRVSIGHSDGDSLQAEHAIALGAASATHTFNAMRRLDHREPGICGTVLSADSLFAELICDGIHVAPAMVQLFARSKGPARAILITDAMAATGMPDGNYKLGELDVRVSQGRCLTGENTLAGSTLTMDAAVRNYSRFAGVPLEAAVYAATRNPAAMTHLPGNSQALERGSRADLNVLSSEGALQATYLGGSLVSH